jgi:hypothetical protein
MPSPPPRTFAMAGQQMAVGRGAVVAMAGAGGCRRCDVVGRRREEGVAGRMDLGVRGNAPRCGYVASSLPRSSAKPLSTQYTVSSTSRSRGPSAGPTSHIPQPLGGQPMRPSPRRCAQSCRPHALRVAPSCVHCCAHIPENRRLSAAEPPSRAAARPVLTRPTLQYRSRDSL